MKRILALLLLLLMSAACAESAPLPYAIESGFLIFPAEDGKQHVPIAVKEGFAAKAQELAAEAAKIKAIKEAEAEAEAKKLDAIAASAAAICVE